MAIDLGADALGFNLWPGSKRYIDLDRASSWIRGLPALVTRVAVLVNFPIEEARRIAAHPAIDAVQFHGDEDESYCAQFAAGGTPFIKAIRVRDVQSLANADGFSTPSVLLDADAGAASFEHDRDGKREELLEAINNAVLAAARKAVGPARDLRVEIDPISGDIQVYAKFTVVETVENKHDEIAFTLAEKFKSGVQVGEHLEVPVTPRDFGRSAAQTAKQAMTQRIYGGTGRQLDPMLAAEAGRRFPDLKVFLAGGLKPENVAEAVRIAQPYAVDVASGVEVEPGRKDQGKMSRFFAALR